MKVSKELEFIAEAFGTLEFHDFRVDTVCISSDLLPSIEKQRDGDFLFGAMIKPTNGEGHIKVFTENKRFMNELFLTDKFDYQEYHEPSNPKCSVCKVIYKDSVGMDKLEARLYPGASSTKGFLAFGEKLQDIIDKDAKTLEELHFTYNEIANAIQEAFNKVNEAEKASKKYEGSFSISKTTKARVIRYMGYQNCPWGCKQHEAMGCSEYIFDNNKHRIVVPQLITHLIREHHFFEGHIAYRVDPKIIIEMLELKHE